MSYRYKVVPFIGQSRGSLSPTDVSAQLEATIQQYARDGWEFIQLSDVNIEVRPGCLAALLGAKVQYVRFDQLIFRADSAVVKPESVSSRATGEQPPGTPATDPGVEDEALPFCYHCGSEVVLGCDSCPTCGKQL